MDESIVHSQDFSNYLFARAGVLMDLFGPNAGVSFLAMHAAHQLQAGKLAIPALAEMN